MPPKTTPVTTGAKKVSAQVKLPPPIAFRVKLKNELKIEVKILPLNTSNFELNFKDHFQAKI